MPTAMHIRGWIKPDGELYLVGDAVTHDKSAFKVFKGFRYRAQAIAHAWKKGWVRVCDNAIQLPGPDDACLRRAQDYVRDHGTVRAMGTVTIEWCRAEDAKQISFLVPTDEFLDLTSIGELARYRSGRWI